LRFAPTRIFRSKYIGDNSQRNSEYEQRDTDRFERDKPLEYASLQGISTGDTLCSRMENQESQSQALTVTPKHLTPAPHLVTILVTLVAPLVTLIAVIVAAWSVHQNNLNFKIANRAYLAITAADFKEEGNTLSISGSLENAGNTPSFNTELYLATVSNDEVGHFFLMRDFGVFEGKGQRTLESTADIIVVGRPQKDNAIYFLIAYKTIFGDQGYLGRCVNKTPRVPECGGKMLHTDAALRHFLDDFGTPPIKINP
jgi:hypothetical protein